MSHINTCYTLPPGQQIVRCLVQLWLSDKKYVLVYWSISLFHPPDDSSSNRKCPRCDVSLRIFSAFLMQWELTPEHRKSSQQSSGPCLLPSGVLSSEAPVNQIPMQSICWHSLYGAPVRGQQESLRCILLLQCPEEIGSLLDLFRLLINVNVIRARFIQNPRNQISATQS